MDVPQDFLASLPDRVTQICVGEALGPLLALIHEGEALKGSLPIFFIDILAVLSCLIMGRSRELDLGALTFGAHLRLFHLGASPWWEYVRSAANLSDGGSRAGVTDPIAAAFGIPLRSLPFPDLPNVLSAPFEDWNTHWRSMA